MKKSFIFTLVVSLGLACAIAIAEGEDAENRQWFSYDTFFAEYQDGAYITQDDYLYYIDDVSFSTVLVCARLNCLHHEESRLDDCDAYIGIYSPIDVYQDRVYFRDTAFENYQYIEAVFSAAGDGSDHRKHMDIDGLMETTYYDYGFNSGYYFYAIVNYPDEMELAQEAYDAYDWVGECDLYCINIRMPEKQPVLLETWKETEATLFLKQIIGDKLYYAFLTDDVGYVLWEYDFLKQTKERILQIDATYRVTIVDDVIYVFSMEEGIFVYDLETGDMENLFTFEHEEDQGYIITDGIYFYVPWKLQGHPDDESDILIIDRQGQTISRIPTPEKLSVIASTQEYIVLTNMMDDHLYAIRKADFFAESPELISIAF